MPRDSRLRSSVWWWRGGTDPGLQAGHRRDGAAGVRQVRRQEVSLPVHTAAVTGPSRARRTWSWSAGRRWRLWRPEGAPLSIPAGQGDVRRPGAVPTEVSQWADSALSDSGLSRVWWSPLNSEYGLVGPEGSRSGGLVRPWGCCPLGYSAERARWGEGRFCPSFHWLTHERIAVAGQARRQSKALNKYLLST